MRWPLRYLRARDVQSATLPLVYVTSGGSNLPVRPKKRPRVPVGRIARRGGFVPGARFLALGDILQTYGHVPHGRFFDSTKIPSHTAIRPPKQKICQKNKKEIARRNRTNDHQTATTDNHGQWNDGLNHSTKGAPYFPHLLVFFVVVWHVFAYQFPTSDDTTVDMCIVLIQKPPHPALILLWLRATRDRTQSYRRVLVDSLLECSASPLQLSVSAAS